MLQYFSHIKGMYEIIPGRALELKSKGKRCMGWKDGMVQPRN
jgi:hypothetical protein